MTICPAGYSQGDVRIAKLVTRGCGVIKVELFAGRQQATGPIIGTLSVKQGMSGKQSQTHTGERAEAWTNYWRTGNRHSCLVTRSDGQEEVPVHDEGWRAFFAAQDSGAKILDIGTGNGAVALLAHEVGQDEGKAFDIHGVDAAQIAPASDAAAGLHFHSGASMEKLPFAENTFDCVVSQYALEYSDMPVSLGEAARVLVPGGKARFILHSSDSTPVQSSRQELEVLKEILDDIGIIKLLRNMLVIQTEKPAKSALSEKKVMTGLKKLETIIQNDKAIMHHVTFFRMGVDIFNKRASFAPAGMIQRLDTMDEDYACVRERLEQMVSAALDVEEFEKFKGSVLEPGFEIIKTDHISGNNEVVGWLIEMCCHRELKR